MRTWAKGAIAAAGLGASAGGWFALRPTPATVPAAAPDPVAEKLARIRTASPTDAKAFLDDADPGIRAAALLVASAPCDAPVLGDEELFRWLNDPDAGVRKVCESALVARGRSAEEIGFGRKMAHPSPAERLSLLLDLRDAGDSVKDVGPWLARLGQDADPAVRAGAARVAVECKLPFADWVDNLARHDPDPTVRHVARYYRGLGSAAVPAGFRAP